MIIFYLWMHMVILRESHIQGVQLSLDRGPYIEGGIYSWQGTTCRSTPELHDLRICLGLALFNLHHVSPHPRQPALAGSQVISLSFVQSSTKGLLDSKKSEQYIYGKSSTYKLLEFVWSKFLPVGSIWILWSISRPITITPFCSWNCCWWWFWRNRWHGSRRRWRGWCCKCWCYCWAGAGSTGRFRQSCMLGFSDNKERFLVGSFNFTFGCRVLWWDGRCPDGRQGGWTLSISIPIPSLTTDKSQWKLVRLWFVVQLSIPITKLESIIVFSQDIMLFGVEILCNILQAKFPTSPILNRKHHLGRFIGKRPFRRGTWRWFSFGCMYWGGRRAPLRSFKTFTRNSRQHWWNANASRGFWQPGNKLSSCSRFMEMATWAWEVAKIRKSYGNMTYVVEVMWPFKSWQGTCGGSWNQTMKGTKLFL